MFILALVLGVERELIVIGLDLLADVLQNVHRYELYPKLSGLSRNRSAPAQGFEESFSVHLLYASPKKAAAQL
jgi:hypothetical protein